MAVENEDMFETIVVRVTITRARPPYEVDAGNGELIAEETYSVAGNSLLLFEGMGNRPLEFNALLRLVEEESPLRGFLQDLRFLVPKYAIAECFVDMPEGPVLLFAVMGESND